MLVVQPSLRAARVARGGFGDRSCQHLAKQRCAIHTRVMPVAVARTAEPHNAEIRMVAVLSMHTLDSSSPEKRPACFDTSMAPFLSTMPLLVASMLTPGHGGGREKWKVEGEGKRQGRGAGRVWRVENWRGERKRVAGLGLKVEVAGAGAAAGAVLVTSVEGVVV